MFSHSDWRIETRMEIQVLHGNAHSEVVDCIQELVFSSVYLLTIMMLQIII